jgi:hypothetical protein
MTAGATARYWAKKARLRCWEHGGNNISTTGEAIK